MSRQTALLAALVLLGHAPAADPPPPPGYRVFELPTAGHIDPPVFSPDGSRLAAGAGDTIVVWDTSTGKQVTRMKLPSPQVYHRLAFTADGKTLVSDCREDEFVRFWDTKTGKQVRERAHPVPRQGRRPGGVVSPHRAFGPGADVCASANREDFTGVDLHEVATGRFKHGFPNAPSGCSVAFSPDGTLLATLGVDGALDLWDVATAKLVRRLQPRDKPPGRSYQSVSFSPDGKYLASCGSKDRGLVVWRVADGTEYRRFPTRSYVRSAAVSGDGRWVAVTPAEGMVRLFDLAAGFEVPGFESPAPRGCNYVTSSPDGKRFAVVCTAVYLADFPAAAVPKGAAEKER